MTPVGTRISYPSELPIVERRQELLETIEKHQVVVVAGETGSGKSTQLPKMCMELGRGLDAWIGHTQPRRIAARSVAERIASELNSKVGETVGFKVRFTDQVSKATRIKLMTDGMLLAEVQRDRSLEQYDTLIVDEAHERSLNIDFLLGYLKRLLARRPDLKVIITSATIDTERFAAHFNKAPIIEVSGRAYPVDIRYRPLDGGEGPKLDLIEGVVAAATELQREGPGDILAFFSGERDIRDTEEALRKERLANTEIVPLYARLSAAEQHKVFEKHSGRRIVLATNVAETSLTVPGIRYVIDTGLARISRFSQRTKVQRLPIEPVSQASANQRSGRCGRIGPGICVRLYDEDDYLARPEFTEPEIQRTNLASVILQMAAMKLGAAEEFPFVDPPDTRAIRDGVALLEELGAVDPTRSGGRKWLTPIGRRLSRLPVDPRLGRMVLEADRRGCLREVMVIASALSVQDPRERPAEKRGSADESHARFVDDRSDFLTYLRLWEYANERRSDLSQNQFRRMCGREFLNFNRLREWRDIHRQLERVAAELRMRPSGGEVEPAEVHRSVLAGLLSQIGLRDRTGHEYRGARNARFAVAPGSALFKASPSWVMAGELVETTRIWARVVAPIDPEWAEDLAPDLVKRTYGDPFWDGEFGAARAYERVTLYGLPLVADRAVHYARVDEGLAREMFIHHALIEGDWHARPAFVSQHAQVLEEARSLEARARRRDLFDEYARRYAFFDERLGPHVTSVIEFDDWYSRILPEEPNRLRLDLSDLLDVDAVDVDESAFPASWQAGELELDLSYETPAAAADDGVSVSVPVSSIGQLDQEAFAWNVPGLREEVVTELIRSLPKGLRKRFVPVPDTVRDILPRLDPDGDLVMGVRRELSALADVHIPVEALRLDELPDRLRPTFRVVDEGGDVLAEGKDLAALRERLDAEVRDALVAAHTGLERSGERQWTFGTLPKVVESADDGRVTAYPTLWDEGDSIGVRLVATKAEQSAAMWNGTRRLLRLNIGAPLRELNGLLTNELKLALAFDPHGGRKEWFEDVVLCALDASMLRQGAPAWDEAAFEKLTQAVRAELADIALEVGPQAAEILKLSGDIRNSLDRLDITRFGAAAADLREHLDRLVFEDHLASAGSARLIDVIRYLSAMHYRISKLAERPGPDRAAMDQCQPLEDEFYRTADLLGWTPEVEEAAWMLEELRVSLFAQQIGTKGKVSAKRVRRKLDSLG